MPDYSYHCPYCGGALEWLDREALPHEARCTSCRQGWQIVFRGGGEHAVFSSSERLTLTPFSIVRDG